MVLDRGAKIGGAVQNLGQHGLWYIQHGADLVAPSAGFDVIHQGARGVGGVRHMGLSAGETPDQKTVDGAEQQLSGFGTAARALNRVENPFDLGAGEIGIEQKPGGVAHHVLMAIIAQNLANLGGAAVLPDDGVVDGAAGGFIPDHGGFALIGDADASNI